MMVNCTFNNDGPPWKCQRCGWVFPRMSSRPPHRNCTQDVDANIINNGPGTFLKLILQKFGIKSTPTCACNKRTQLMNHNGVEWCEENIEQIVDWLQEEANKRKLPFIRLAGKILVKKAIRDSKRAQQTLGKNHDDTP